MLLSSLKISMEHQFDNSFLNIDIKYIIRKYNLFKMFKILITVVLIWSTVSLHMATRRFYNNLSVENFMGE